MHSGSSSEARNEKFAFKKPLRLAYGVEIIRMSTASKCVRMHLVCVTGSGSMDGCSSFGSCALFSDYSDCPRNAAFDECVFEAVYSFRNIAKSFFCGRECGMLCTHSHCVAATT